MNVFGRSDAAMSEASRCEVRAGLESCLPRLWRYALTLSNASDVAEDLVQAICLRAIERADQCSPGTRLDRWLFVILRSIWLNELRARRIRESGGFHAAEDGRATPNIGGGDARQRRKVLRFMKPGPTAISPELDATDRRRRRHGRPYRRREASQPSAIPSSTARRA
jgi:RNA polymerase sigma factor (sigma-70 family)